MPSIDRIDENGAVVGQHELADALVQDQINIGLLHQVVTAELAGHRQGTASAKSRGEVAGTGAKQWRQKGTGRARVGSGKVSQFTGGGVAFPPIPRGYAIKVNKKVRAQAFRMALADLVAGGTVRVLSGAEFDEPSTKRAATILEQGRARQASAGPGRRRGDRGPQELPQPRRHPGSAHRRGRSAGLRLGQEPAVHRSGRVLPRRWPERRR